VEGDKHQDKFDDRSDRRGKEEARKRCQDKGTDAVAEDANALEERYLSTKQQGVECHHDSTQPHNDIDEAEYHLLLILWGICPQNARTKHT